MNKKGLRKVCDKGHVFYKSSDCPVCPICEGGRKPETGFLSVVGAPARRALEREGITTVKKLSTYTKKEILALHGVGPSAIPKLEHVLKDEGLGFAK